METEGIKDFYIQNKECECIICKRKFMASRSNIKRCNSIHYCYVIDYFIGKIYKKEIMKWNKIYWENNKDLNNDNNNKEICYLEGLCFSNKSNQVSVNNMMTLFNHTNNMQNMTTERRQKIIISQKERGTFALTTKNNDGSINEEKYEKHSKNSKILAKKRIEDGTQNFQYLYNIECNKNFKNYSNCINKDNINIKKNINGICEENGSSHGLKLKFCEKCNKNTFHNGTKCIICNPKSKCGLVNYLVYIDEQKYYYDISINEYVKWNDYCEKFKINIDINNTNDNSNNININLKEIKEFCSKENFEIITTFRSQNSQDWTGARIAFEESLVENNIGWFIYVKLTEYNKLLLCGKTGSLLVNKSGTDVNFSKDEKDGPARQFLKENNITWNKTIILIKRCNSEKEALIVEKDIQKRYGLFGS